MAIKDFNTAENSDHGKKNELPEMDKTNLEKKEQEGQTKIKNAHATGDGSFGRSESSLPEEEDEKTRGNATY